MFGWPCNNYSDYSNMEKGTQSDGQLLQLTFIIAQNMVADVQCS